MPRLARSPMGSNGGGRPTILHRRERAFPAALSAIGFVFLALLVPTALGGSAAPPLAFTPSSYDYGTIDIDFGTPASQTFVLSNTGGSATGTLSVSLSGSSAFSKTADTCTAVSLGPRKSCSVTVQYAPTGYGSSDTGTLTASGEKAVATASLSGASGRPNISRLHCEFFGGTYTTGTGTTLWTCNGWVNYGHDNYYTNYYTLLDDCFYVDGGNAWGSTFPPNIPGTNDSSCARF